MKSWAQKAVVVAAVLLAVPAFAQEVPVDNEAFGITLPAGFGEFAKQSLSTDSPQGKIETTNYVSKAPTGEAVVVTVSRMPAKIGDPQKLIASTRDSLVSSLKATLEAEQNVEGGMPANDFSASTAAVFLKSRLAVLENTLYQVLYVGRSAEQRAVPAVSTMFASFKPKAAHAAAPAAAAPATTPGE
ncbi:MAG: hypothetical protein WA208_17110 [Thermoanaerobaculia bacterium]